MAPRAPHHPRGLGFTFIEVMLAMALASIVVTGALSLILTVTRVDKKQADRFEDRRRLVIAHRVIRNAMQTLVAGEPEIEEPPPTAAPSDADDPSVAELIEGVDPSMAAMLSDLGISMDPSQLAMLASAPDDAPAHFELYDEPMHTGLALPRLELVLQRPPAPQVRSADLDARLSDDDDDQQRKDLAYERVRRAVRGAFALEPLGKGYSLVWRPLDTTEDAFALIDDVQMCIWEVLPKLSGEEGTGSSAASDTERWTDVHAAYLLQDFPLAVRLRLETVSGVQVNWVFEVTAVIEGGL